MGARFPSLINNSFTPSLPPFFHPRSQITDLPSRTVNTVALQSIRVPPCPPRAISRAARLQRRRHADTPTPTPPASPRLTRWMNHAVMHTRALSASVDGLEFPQLKACFRPSVRQASGEGGAEDHFFFLPFLPFLPFFPWGGGGGGSSLYSDSSCTTCTHICLYIHIDR